MSEYIEKIDEEIEQAFGGCGHKVTEGDNTWVCGKTIGNTDVRFYCERYACETDIQKIKLLEARKQGYIDAKKEVQNNE